MISLEDYFRDYEHDEATRDAAAKMLDKVNNLLLSAEAHGVEIQTNPKTQTCISGEKYGGFRPQDCPIGAPKSAHKVGRAVDVYDPNNDLDRWLTDARLEEFELYRESPQATPRWCHLSDKSPASGRRTFNP
jgi:hypothetical protein